MTPQGCPDPALLRALVEPLALEGLLPEGAAQATRAHALACPRCQKRLALAAKEEQALRALATPVEPDAALLAATLEAVRQTAAGSRDPVPSRRHRSASGAPRRVSWAAAGVALGLGLVAVALLRVRSPETDSPPSEPDAVASPRPSPSAVARSPEPSPAARPSPAPDAIPRPTPGDPDAGSPVAPVPESSPPPGPDAQPSPDAGSLALGPSPAPATPGPTTPGPGDPTTGGRTLARAASLGLSVAGRALALGDALPEGSTVEVQTAGARVESEGAVSLLFAQHTLLSVERQGDGEASFVLASGKALVTTIGASAYSVGTADVSARVEAASPARAIAAGGRAMFVLAAEGPSATFTTLEGSIRVDSRRPAASDVATVVPAGFAVATQKGKRREAAQPVDAARMLEWLPKKQRPTTRPIQRRVVRALDAEADRRLVTDGALSPADATSARPFVAGVVSSDERAMRWSDKSPSLARVDPTTLLEVTIRASRASTLHVMVFDDTANENFEWTTEVPAGKWLTLVAPLSDFANKAKAPRPIQRGDVVHALRLAASPDGAHVELAVQGARFLGEP